MATQVSMWKDTEGKLWPTLEEANAADIGYERDKVLLEHRTHFVRMLNGYAGIGLHEANKVANFMFAKYDMSSLKQLDGEKE